MNACGHGSLQFEAYELYVHGRAPTMQRGTGIVQALECFERAIELDPSYAPAHAGLAEALRTHPRFPELERLIGAWLSEA